MNTNDILEAENLLDQAIAFYHGIGHEKNTIKAKELLIASAELGLDKSINLLGDWYRKDLLPNKDYQEAVRWYEKGCEIGSCQSFFRLAMCYDMGIGTSKDISRAIELYEKAYELGAIEACFNLARIHEKGVDVPQDISLAISWYVKGAERGDADCACNLGFCYYRGNGVPKDVDKAKDLFLKYSDYSALVQKNLGVIFYTGTPECKPDVEEAIHWFTKAANNGNVSSMLYLGNIFRKDKKLNIALEWYKKAAIVGGKKAAYTYAFFLYKYSEEEERDQAFYWMKRAAENEFAPAQFMLGLFYNCEVGTTLNYEKAFYWFNLAAENGSEQAYSHIGRFYRDGRVVEKNYETALFWFEKAIASKDDNVKSEALFDYGCMHLDGWGVKKDKKKALGYFTKSKDLGCINAINKLIELGNPKNPPKDIDDAYIIEHGNIIEYVQMKIQNSPRQANWVDNVLEKLKIYIKCLNDYHLVIGTDNGLPRWILGNKDYAQWIIYVSNDLHLYELVQDDRRSYHPMYFANLFLNKKGARFKPEDLRHDICEINKFKEVKNVEKIRSVIEKAKKIIEAKRL